MVKKAKASKPAPETAINAIRMGAVTQAFREGDGQRALVLIGQFPFLVIGEIDRVASDYVLVKVETTHITEIEGKTIRIHIDEIEAFYIEGHGPSIPSIR